MDCSVGSKTCLDCRSRDGMIWSMTNKPDKEPQLYLNCRCSILVMKTVKSGTATINGIDGADWVLKNKGKLPDYYISRDQAKKKGWVPKLGNLKTVCPSCMILGGIYYNDNNHLTVRDGRTWNEANINYQYGYRNTQRVLYSNDGLIFVTYDHYQTFFEIV